MTGGSRREGPYLPGRGDVGVADVSQYSAVVPDDADADLVGAALEAHDEDHRCAERSEEIGVPVWESAALSDGEVLPGRKKLLIPSSRLSSSLASLPPFATS